jgi:5-methylcytosine-specific restriction endonuclease McrA
MASTRAEKAARERRRRIAEGSDGTVTRAVIQALHATRRCAYCRRRIVRRQRTIDHKLPLSRGGGHTAGNLVMACRTCNGRKGNLTAAEFGHPGRLQQAATWFWLAAIMVLFITAVARA